ncbi:MAG: hypothetical protein ABIR71_14130 [Chthoniobacterales bacterium]
MPKKTKIPTPAPDASQEAAPISPSPASAAPVPPARRRATADKATSRKAVSKKKAPTGGSKKAATKKPARKKPATEPSDAEIATRAYFIAERRFQQGVGGDSAHDWLEAKKQLLAERPA